MRAIGATAVLCGVLSLSSVASAKEIVIEVIFPVTIEPAVKLDTEIVKPDGIAYSQPVRSTKAVRLKADLVASYKPDFMSRSGLNGRVTASTLHTPIKQGTIMIVALLKGREMYCAAGAEKEPDFWGYYDGAVCLRDTNNDGVFDEQLAVDQYPWRVRSAYEITQAGPNNWTSVSIPYEALAPADIPAGDINVHYDFRKGTWLSLPVAWLDPRICWPSALVYGSSSESPRNLCGSLIGFSGVNTQISLRKNAKGEIKYSKMTIRYEHHDDDSLKTEVVAEIKPGPANLAVIARDASADGRDQTTIFDLLPNIVFPNLTP